MTESTQDTRQYFTVFLEETKSPDRRAKNLELHKRIFEGDNVYGHKLECTAFQDDVLYNLEVYVVATHSMSHHSNALEGSRWSERLMQAKFTDIKPKGAWKHGTYKIPNAKPLPPAKAKSKVL